MSINEAVCGKKSRGRPKQFDRDRALESALDLFWRHGYEATSLADLVEVTGAKAPTLYAEFGNKEGMFRAAVERYLQNTPPAPTSCWNRMCRWPRSSRPTCALPSKCLPTPIRRQAVLWCAPPRHCRLLPTTSPRCCAKTSCPGSGAESLLRSQGAAGRIVGENRYRAAGEIRHLHH